MSLHVLYKKGGSDQEVKKHLIGHVHIYHTTEMFTVQYISILTYPGGPHDSRTYIRVANTVQWVCETWYIPQIEVFVKIRWIPMRSSISPLSVKAACRTAWIVCGVFQFSFPHFELERLYHFRTGLHIVPKSHY